VNSIDFCGQTALSFAACYGHLAICQLLLKRDDLTPDVKDHSSETPLWYAAEKGHESVVHLLLNPYILLRTKERDYIANDSYEGITILHRL
jgi:ankyrin repeat protein